MSKAKNRRGGRNNRAKSTIRRIDNAPKSGMNKLKLSEDPSKWTQMQRNIGKKLIEATNLLGQLKQFCKEIEEEDGRSALVAKAVHIAVEKAWEICRNNTMATGLGKPQDPRDPYNIVKDTPIQAEEDKGVTDTEEEADGKEPADEETEDVPAEDEEGKKAVPRAHPHMPDRKKTD